MKLLSSLFPESESRGSAARPSWTPWVLLALWWLLLRAFFFTGFVGSDDYFHLRYANHWDAPPVNHWEARLVFNAIHRFLVHSLGNSEWIWALPSLAGSLLLVTAAIRGAVLAGGPQAGLFAGWLAASMPLDVVLSTVPLASALSSGIAGWCFVELVSGRLLLAALFGALAATVHPVNLHFVLISALVVSAFRKKPGPLAAAGLAIGLYIVLDLGVNAFFWADPFHNLRILRQWRDPDPIYRPGSAPWFLAPVLSLVFCKDFGLTAISALAVPVLWLRGRPWLSLCSATIAAFWFWIGFGSVKPTEYEPFWRLTRFLYPLIVPVSINLACLAVARGRQGMALAAAFASLHLVLVAGSGSYGESAEISRAFVADVRGHPEQPFLTDVRTEREMTAWNGYKPLPNLRSFAAVCSSGQARGNWWLIENPLNLEPLRNVAQVRPVMTPEGKPVRTLAPLPRRLLFWAPRSWWERWPVLLRRPEARLLPVKAAGCQS